jgi:hypothetical protein
MPWTWIFEILKKVGPGIIAWVLERLLKPKPAPVPEEPKPVPPKPTPVPVPVPEPKPVPPPPPPPEYDSGMLELMAEQPFFVLLAKGEPAIKHKKGQVILIGTQPGDEFFADKWLLQTIGTVRLSIILKSPGTRTLKVRRNGEFIAEMTVMVKY